MHKSTRQILFLFFAAAFLVSAPLVVLFTAGFRISLNNQRIQQTGAIAVNTTPRGAIVTVNDQAISGKTPTVAQRVTPNEKISIRIEKTGYTTWEQSVLVDAGQTTYVNALLFADSAPEKVASTEIVPPQPIVTPIDVSFIDNGEMIEVHAILENENRLIGLLPQGTYLPLRTDDDYVILKNSRNDLYLISLTSSDVIALSTPTTVYDWLPDENMLVWSDGLEVNIYQADERQRVFLTRQSDLITNVQWHPNGEAIFISTSNGITALEIEQHENRVQTPLIQNETVNTFWIDEAGKNLYFSSTSAGTEELYRKRLVK